MILKEAYDQVKSDYTYIDDVRCASDLPNNIFYACVRELAKKGVIEFLPGTEFRTEKQGFEINGVLFFGMTWLDDTKIGENEKAEKTAFERLFEKIREITAVMESCDKKTAVGIIRTEFSEFSDMNDNTIKSNITSFPFLFNVTETSGTRSDRIGKQNEMDQLRQENDALKSDIQKYIEKNIQQQEESYNLKIEIDNLEAEKNIQPNIQSDIQKEFFMDLQEKVVSLESHIRSLAEKYDGLVTEIGNLKKPDDIQENIENIQPAEKKKIRIGKWSIVQQNSYYKAVRNFGKKADGKSDIQQIYIGKIYKEETAREKIAEKGFSVD